MISSGNVSRLVEIANTESLHCMRNQGPGSRKTTGKCAVTAVSEIPLDHNGARVLGLLLRAIHPANPELLVFRWLALRHEHDGKTTMRMNGLPVLHLEDPGSGRLLFVVPVLVLMAGPSADLSTDPSAAVGLVDTASLVTSHCAHPSITATAGRGTGDGRL